VRLREIWASGNGGFPAAAGAGRLGPGSGGGAPGPEALKQDAGRLVGRVLRHQLAGEGFLQDRLPQRLGFAQVGVEVGFYYL
jgi:hypothetical protein